MIANYKVDNGSVPREADSDYLDPRVHGAPATIDRDNYKKACIVLYKAITGDKDLEGKLDSDGKDYVGKELSLEYLRFDNPTSPNRRLEFIQDPFGNCYGYSTLGARAQQEYQDLIKGGDTTVAHSSGRGLTPRLTCGLLLAQTDPRPRSQSASAG